MLTPWQNKRIRDSQKKLVTKERKPQSGANQYDPRKAAADGVDARITGTIARSSTSSSTDLGSYGAAGSTGGSRLARHASPWGGGPGPMLRRGSRIQ